MKDLIISLVLFAVVLIAALALTGLPGVAIFSAVTLGLLLLWILSKAV